MQTAAEERRTPDLQVPAMPAVVTEKAVRTYLADLTAKGRSADTVRMYASRLRTLWEDLPPDKQVRRETLADWQDTLLDRGYSPRDRQHPPLRRQRPAGAHGAAGPAAVASWTSCRRSSRS